MKNKKEGKQRKAPMKRKKEWEVKNFMKKEKGVSRPHTDCIYKRRKEAKKRKGT